MATDLASSKGTWLPTGQRVASIPVEGRHRLLLGHPEAGAALELELRPGVPVQAEPDMSPVPQQWRCTMCDATLGAEAIWCPEGHWQPLLGEPVTAHPALA